MIKFLLSFIGFWSFCAFAINCDCEVRVYSPLTASHELSSATVKKYLLNTYNSYSVKNQVECRQQCLEQFQDDLPTAKLNNILLAYSDELIGKGILGYNCTGLTTVRYPVRVKAKLGNLGLGNLVNQIQVISLEKECF